MVLVIIPCTWTANCACFRGKGGAGTLPALLFPFRASGVVINTEQGYYSLSASFPSSARVGRNDLTLVIGDKGSKRPVDKKLDIEVVPWMTTHEHGSDEFPVIRKTGPGTYLVQHVDFTMPGAWQVYIKIKDGTREDTAVFDVNVAK